MRHGIILFLGLFLTVNYSFGQVPYVDQTFVGGVCGFGFSATPGTGSGTVPMRWIDGMVVTRAYAFTGRYNRPVEPYTMAVNGYHFDWSYNNQFGSEHSDLGPDDYYATHVVELPPEIFNSDQCEIDFPHNDNPGNMGYWSIYIVVYYEHPSITDPVRVLSYGSDQRQDQTFTTQIDEYFYDESQDLGLAVHMDRITNSYSDRSGVGLNNFFLGICYTNEIGQPYGALGQFFYENGELFGLGDDIPNNSFFQSDAIAVINEYHNSGDDMDVAIGKLGTPDYGNMHPSFHLVSTPLCVPDETNIPRLYEICRGDTVQLDGGAGFDTYTWYPSMGLDDTSIQTPICFADTSRYYTVTATNSDGCRISESILVRVADIPIPGEIEIFPTTCQSQVGFVEFNDVPGDRPIRYTLNNDSQFTPLFSQLETGTYHAHLETDAGCTWDTTLFVPIDIFVEAAFDALPPNGYTPLEVLFSNQSTNADSYIWLIDGVEISEAEDIKNTFSEPGVYEIELIAFYQSQTCSDTASFALMVDQGIELLIPNIISPNNDGRNDQLIAQTTGVANLSWIITDRWGREVHAGSTRNEDGEVLLWDPADIPTGAHVVTITAVGISGQTRQEAFYVQIVR